LYVVGIFLQLFLTLALYGGGGYLDLCPGYFTLGREHTVPIEEVTDVAPQPVWMLWRRESSHMPTVKEARIFWSCSLWPVLSQFLLDLDIKEI
jgi:hypothetical protein